MDGEKQKELFEFDDRPRKSFPGFERMLPKADFEGKVSVTLGLEKIIFIAIGIVLSMVIVFALGVERGRSIETAATENLEEPPVTADKPQDTVKASAKITMPPQTAQPKAIIAAAATAGSPSPVQKAVAQSEPDDIKARPFTIVAAAHNGRDTAALAINWLKKEGYPAYLKQDGQYFLVCVGPYANKNAAQAALGRVKRLYKDAYVMARQL